MLAFSSFTDFAISAFCYGLGGGCIGYLIQKWRNKGPKWRYSVIDILVLMTMIAAYIVAVKH
jgi:hypothetical protein